MRKILGIMVLCVLFLQGCSSSKNTAEEADEATTNSITAAVTEAAKEVAATEAVTQIPEDKAIATPVPVQLLLPVVTNDTGKVLIQAVSASQSYRTNSYIITSVNGELVVVDPTAMPAKKIVDINPAAIVSTHSHDDHNDVRFVREYPDAQTLLYTEGELQTKDFHIYTIKSSHATDTIDGSNNIIVFEVDGLRIAHMGDIGQTVLTQEQLKALGEIDIAFMQFENSYSNMSVANEKGFNLIEQVNPKIIIPTHYFAGAITALKERYGEFTGIDNKLEITKEELPEASLQVYEMLNTLKYR